MCVLPRLCQWLPFIPLCIHAWIFTECFLCKCSYWMLEIHSPQVQMGLSLLGNCVTCPGYRVWNWQTLHCDKSWFVRHPPRPLPSSAVLHHLLKVKLRHIGLVTRTWFPFHIEKREVSPLISVLKYKLSCLRKLGFSTPSLPFIMAWGWKCASQAPMSSSSEPRCRHLLTVLFQL